MISTILITVLLEGAMVLVYCSRTKKPCLPILGTSFLGNVLTQSLLWSVLRAFFLHYLTALVIAEVSICFLEGLLYSQIAQNELSWSESMRLSLVMNLSSFALGWFLPV